MMTHPLKGLVAVIAASIGLTGCGSLFGDDSGGGSGGGGTLDASYDAQVIQSLDLFRTYNGVGQTPVDQMPEAGFATYSGVVGFSHDTAPTSVADYDIMSDVTLRAEFGTNGTDGTMTGTMENFNTVDDVEMNGMLTLTEGQITGSTLTANAIGSFSDGTDAAIWDLEVTANFVGAGGASIIGTANGTITNGGSVTSTVFGDLVADTN